MKSYLTCVTVLIAALALCAVPTARAGEANWPQWRGPNFDGSSDASNLPAVISKDKALWSTTLPGAGNGSPIIWGENVFVSTVDQENKKNNVASPSCVTDGKLVWFHWATGDLAAFDLKGKEVWSRNLQKDYGPFHYNWIYGSSPMLYKGKLYVQVLHRDLPYDKAAPAGEKAESYLLALNPADGKELFRIIRPTEALNETQEAYSTPMPVEVNGHTEIVVVGGDAVTGHDADSGAELWRYTGWNPTKIGQWRLVPSVVCGEGIIVACAPKGGPIMAIKAGGHGKLTDADLAWKSDKLTSDVCVPFFYKHDLYVFDGDKHGPAMGTLSCVDPHDGKVKHSASFGGKVVYRASATVADGKIYCMNEAGDVVVAAVDDFKVLSQTSLDGSPSRGSIAVVDGMAVIRSNMTLYGFGEKK
jgi:outer membrane protein assembly factor BamB